MHACITNNDEEDVVENEDGHQEQPPEVPFGSGVQHHLCPQAGKGGWHGGGGGVAWGGGWYGEGGGGMGG